MSEYENQYWQMRIEKCSINLKKNNFEVYISPSLQETKQVIISEILPSLSYRSVSYGDSLSMISTGILDTFRDDSSIDFIETFDPTYSLNDKIEIRRKALLADLFLTGTNAVTETGKLVNLDMIGNRVGAITFGPFHVIIVVGRNKIVKSVSEAMDRVKTVAAPLNAIRHTGFKTPCIKTGECHDCSSPDRICNSWTITEKSFPKNRIKVVIVNEDLGL